jgi:asparagine synthase (glutamine-hydrolysing)
LGGDELFGGYARYLLAYFEQCIKGAIHETQEEGKHVATMNNIIESLPLLREYVPMMQRFWSSGLFEDMDKRYFSLVNRCSHLSSLLHPNLRSLGTPQRMFEEFKTVFDHPQTKSYLCKMLRFDQQTLLPALLQVEDRVSMGVSIEARVPFLDRRIAELAASIPPRLMFGNGQMKYLLRKAVRHIVPSGVLGRKDKKGFPLPLKEWWQQGNLRDFVKDILLSNRCRDRGIIEPAALQALLARETGEGRALWGVLCLELWFRTFLDNEVVSK